MAERTESGRPSFRLWVVGARVLPRDRKSPVVPRRIGDQMKKRRRVGGSPSGIPPQKAQSRFPVSPRPGPLSGRRDYTAHPPDKTLERRTGGTRRLSGRRRNPLSDRGSTTLPRLRVEGASGTVSTVFDRSGTPRSWSVLSVSGVFVGKVNSTG